MQHFQRLQQVAGFLTAALECSVYVSPMKPGLTYDELVEFGRLVGIQPGEIGDAMQQVSKTYFGVPMILPDPTKIIGWVAPHIIEEPDFRNFTAFDFWHAAMSESAKANGAALARLDREVVIERAAARGIPRHDMEVALGIDILCANVIDKDGVIVPARGKLAWPSISEQRKGGGVFGAPRRNENRARAFPLVKDIIQRRTDGRPRYAEPLDAFTDGLDGLGYGHFKVWWAQMVSQLRQTDPETTPVAVLVLAAALVEGCLTFVVKHGRGLGVGVFGSKDFDEDPRRWKIETLVNGAAAGQKDAILDNRDKQRVETLVASRQRIHAGRMLSEFPGGVPDLRPEEAREAKAIADMLVRRVLDWLELHSAAK